MSDVILDGRSLSLEDVRQVALGPETEVGLSEEAVARMADSRALIERLVSSGEPVYGVTTGFGRLADVTIPPDDRTTLQHNLVRSHASGMGDAMDREAVRALMVLRANALARGHSGCRVVLVERLLELLNSGIHPRVPEFGSVGASGDLAPLAHVALALIGEGPAEKGGTESPVQGLLADAGIEPVTLGSKEGLALINGTQATTGLGILALLAAERALETAEVAGAMSLDALLGTPEAFREEIQDARPHAGQARSAARLRALLAGSQIRESHREGDPRVQDATRCGACPRYTARPAKLSRTFTAFSRPSRTAPPTTRWYSRRRAWSSAAGTSTLRSCLTGAGSARHRGRGPGSDFRAAYRTSAESRFVDGTCRRS